MVLTLTALVELFGFFTLSILSYRFYQAHRERKSLISRLLFYFVSLLTLYFFFDGLLILFFAENSFVLKISIVTGIFFQSLACAVIAYLFLYITNLKISPLFGFLFVLILGLGITALAFNSQFHPSWELVGSIRIINWNLPPIIGFLQFITFFITFIPLSCIFLLYSQISKISFIRIRSFGMVLVVLLGLNAALINFFLKDILRLNPLSGDIAFGLFSLFLFTLLLYFSFQSENFEKRISSPFQI